MATLFKFEYRQGLLGRDKPGPSNDKPKGLLGGPEKVRSVLGDATKQDDLLKKTLVPRFSTKSRSGHERRRSRSRSRSPRSGQGKASRSTRTRGGGKPYKSRNKSTFIDIDNKKGDSEDPGKTARASSSKGKGRGKKSSYKKGEYLTPQSFSEAWLSFFSKAAIMMVTAVGLAVNMIPTLDKLPLAGRLSSCIQDWRKICPSSWVCDVVEFGYKIPLKYIPTQFVIPSNPPVVSNAHEVLVDEANELKRKGAVSVVDHLDGEYISSYFAVPKPRSPGKFRPILNLKYFNKCVKKYKFKMETLASVREWIREGSFCTGLDLKDAYPHIGMHESSKKYLRFVWLGELLQWDALPFGLTCSPRVLTKLLKPIVAFLRATWAILISIYMDDMLIQAASVSEVLLHTQLVMLVMMCLGWSFNFKKSVFVPSQTIVHLGFVFDTVSMTISCPKDKIMRLVVMCRSALKDGFITVHALEKLLGTMESVRPCTPLAALHYRSLQKQLISAKRYGRRPSKRVLLCKKSLFHLQWWVSDSGFPGNCSSPIREGQPSLDIWADANLSMGGARSSRGECFQRTWTKMELSRKPSINLLELRAAREGLKSLSRPGDVVRLHLDNRTACAYITKQGGTKSHLLSEEACRLWEEALEKGVTLLAPHWLSTQDNVEADFLSRNKLEHWEFMLEKSVFNMVLETFHVRPTLDAFASKGTAQLPRYMTWSRDPQAVASDALLHKWDPVTYLFPPVPLIMKVLHKVRAQRIRAVMVCPHWSSALWWPMLVELLVEPPLPLPYYQKALQMRNLEAKLPYLEPLVAVHISSLHLE